MYVHMLLSNSNSRTKPWAFLKNTQIPDNWHHVAIKPDIDSILFFFFFALIVKQADIHVYTCSKRKPVNHQSSWCNILATFVLIIQYPVLLKV